MNNEIISALIGVGGIIIGSILTFLIQIITNKIYSKAENRRITYQLKIDTYADAIRYINLYCKIKILESDNDDKRDNVDELKKLLEKESELYNKFHPIFSIIASKDVIEKYNDLRNEIDKNNLKPEVAYQKVIDILDFNISNEIKD